MLGSQPHFFSHLGEHSASSHCRTACWSQVFDPSSSPPCRGFTWEQWSHVSGAPTPPDQNLQPRHFDTRPTLPRRVRTLSVIHVDPHLLHMQMVTQDTFPLTCRGDGQSVECLRTDLQDPPALPPQKTDCTPNCTCFIHIFRERFSGQHRCKKPMNPFACNF